MSLPESKYFPQLSHYTDVALSLAICARNCECRVCSARLLPTPAPRYYPTCVYLVPQQLGTIEDVCLNQVWHTAHCKSVLKYCQNKWCRPERQSLVKQNGTFRETINVQGVDFIVLTLAAEARRRKKEGLVLCPWEAELPLCSAVAVEPDRPPEH